MNFVDFLDLIGARLQIYQRDFLLANEAFMGAVKSTTDVMQVLLTEHFLIGKHPNESADVYFSRMIKKERARKRYHRIYSRGKK